MLTNYLKLAIKVLLRRKFFTFVSFFGVCFTLTVLIVATAMLDHEFSAHYPELKLDRMVGVHRARMSGPTNSRDAAAGYRVIERTVRKLEGAERITVFQLHEQVAAYQDGRKLTLWLKHADGEFWRVFDFDFVEGAPYSQVDEERAGFVAVINESTRRALFGGASALGKSIEVDGQRFRITGVVRDVPFTRIRPFSDVWVPISTMKSASYREEMIGSFMAVVLAKQKGDIPALRRQFDELVRAMPLPDPVRFTRYETALETPFESLARTMELPSPNALRGIFLLFAVLFMTLPAINLVNLNLSRILERSSEIGVRRAFGATRATLIGQFVVENVVLTLIGGVLALGLSAITLSLINGSGLIPYAQFTINFRIFLWGFVIALAFGLFSGVYPAWRMSRMSPVNALKGNA
ncbi:MAG: FtsX-like permease family protein [Thermoanaerobaculia bacterium]|jgi:putative ABC transport system permease protein